MGIEKKKKKVGRKEPLIFVRLHSWWGMMKLLQGRARGELTTHASQWDAPRIRLPEVTPALTKLRSTVSVVC